MRGEICVVRTSGAGYEYCIVAASITPDPGCDAIENYSTGEIFDLVAFAAVTRAVELGKSPCGSAPWFNTKVWSVACVDRTGSGDTTVFATCAPVTCSARMFTVTCLGAGVSNVANTTGTGVGPSCASNCETTVP